MKNIIIENAKFEDALAIAKVHVYSWQDAYRGIVADNYLDEVLSVEKSVINWQKRIENPDYITIVAKFEEQIIGFACGSKSRSKELSFEAEIQAIYILNEFRRSGVGKLLVESFIKKLQKKGYNSCVAWVLAENSATNFYKSLGGIFAATKTINIAEKNHLAEAWGFNFNQKVEPELYKLAVEAAQKAYSPYSGFKVGAALKCKNGKVFTGCNVENASYGLSNCAERTAIFKAVSEGYKEFSTIYIYVDSDIIFPPCGACRQVLAEFGNDIEVVYFNKTGKLVFSSVKKLLPESFKL